MKPSLCLYNPREVFLALQTNPTITKWLRFIATKYEPPGGKVVLFYPCSALKPYDKSPSYRRLLRSLEQNQLRSKVHIITISEPFGLVPEEFYSNGFSWYDCPGLFKWWCLRHDEPYEEEYLEKSIELLSSHIAAFLLRIVKSPLRNSVIGFVRTMTSSFERRADHTHYRMLKNASKLAQLDFEILPRKNVVRKIVLERGRLAWDYYGVSHPMALSSLKNRIRSLSGRTPVFSS